MSFPVPYSRTDLASIGSTNSFALEQLKDQRAPELPWLITTQEQTAGRGRGGNRWWAGAGGLTFSLVIEASAFGIPMESLGLLSLVTGLALAETLEAQWPQLRIDLKWPNDLYLQGRKLGGILIEAQPYREDVFVVGVGLNTSNTLQEAPEELQATAVSVRDYLKTDDEVALSVEDCVENLFAWYRQMGPSRAELLSRWQSRSLLQDKIITLRCGDETITGRCCGITPHGALRLTTPAGERILFGGTVERF